MYAIVKSGGKQYRVERGQRLLVERLAADEGESVALQPLLFCSDEAVLDEAGLRKVRVSARVIGHERGEKLRVFKFKPKRGYKRRTGHRQELTRIEVTELALGADRSPGAGQRAKAKPVPAGAGALAGAPVSEPTAKPRAKPEPAERVPGKPAPAKRALAKPASAKPALAKPALAKPALAKPAPAKPTSAKVPSAKVPSAKAPSAKAPSAKDASAKPDAKPAPAKPGPAKQAAKPRAAKKETKPDGA
jgi:large subunit ribosomal protein L21